MQDPVELPGVYGDRLSSDVLAVHDGGNLTG
jgi:hypothetical protein